MRACLLIALLSFAACEAADDVPVLDYPPIDAPRVIDAPDAATTCTGSPSGGCDRIVDDLSGCPGLDICTGVCGPASHDCCFCDTMNGPAHWNTQITDCAPCDAGVDSPEPSR